MNYSSGNTFNDLPALVTEINAKMDRLFEALESRINPPVAQTLTEGFLNVQQAASFLKLGTQSIYGKVSKGEIPHMKRGNKLYFSKQDLTEWIKAGRKPTAVEIELITEEFLTSKKKGIKL